MPSPPAQQAAQQAIKFVAAALEVAPTAEELAVASPTNVGSTAAAIARRTSQAQELLGGSSVGDQAEVQQWLLWASTEFHPLRDDKLVQVNAWLETRTYLSSNRLTVADLALFGMVHPAVVLFPFAQYNHYANVLRWADLIQAVVGPDVVDSTLAGGRFALPKPLFVPPAPPPPPAPAAAAAPSGKGADAAQPAKGAAAPAAAAAAAASSAAPAAKGAAAAAAGGDKAAGKAAAGGKDKAAGKGPAPVAAEAGAGPSVAAAAAPAPAAAAAAASTSSSGEGKAKKEKEPKAAAAPAADAEPRIDHLDIRVGRIVKVGKHPNADALYVEEIDLGEAQPRQIISGLVKFVPIEEMQGRVVLVVCNLKPAKMRDVMSYGMVLCASNDTHDKVVPVLVPEGVPVGERVSVPGYDQPALAEVNAGKKKNALEQLLPDLKTNADGVPCWKGLPFTTSKGVVTSPLPDAWVR